MFGRNVQSYDVLNRINRALNQKIFLLKANFNDGVWTFYVQGTTFNTYEVIISDKKVECSCPDCQTRGYTCKHIIFIVGKVAKNEKKLKEITLNPLSVKLDQELTDSLTSRLTKRMEKKIKNNLIEIVEEENQEDCIICFDPITSINREEQQCKVCGIIYHTACINKWLKNSGLCCHCKQPWKNNESVDELQMLKSFVKN